MTHRATFALDEATTQRIRSLAASWNVSQAEVVRRAVAQAEAPLEKSDPLAMLRALHDSGEGLAAGDAEAWLAEIREDRKQWRSQ